MRSALDGLALAIFSLVIPALISIAMEKYEERQHRKREGESLARFFMRHAENALLDRFNNRHGR